MPRRDCACGCGRTCTSADGYARGHTPITAGEGPTKHCLRCGAIRLVVDFYEDRRRQDGLAASCKRCDRRRLSKSRVRIKDADPNGLKEPVRQRALMATYGITAAEFAAIFDAQKGACYICGRRPVTKPLCVDHDHHCCGGSVSCGGCIRALLCTPCNRYLGIIGDDPNKLRRAIEVLELHPAQLVLNRLRT